MKKAKKNAAAVELGRMRQAKTTKDERSAAGKKARAAGLAKQRRLETAWKALASWARDVDGALFHKHLTTAQRSNLSEILRELRDAGWEE